MTLDRQGAVAVYEVGRQQSFDWFEDDKMSKCIGEIRGNVHGFGESEFGQGRRSSDKQEKSERGNSSGNTADPRCKWRHVSVINQEIDG